MEHILFSTSVDVVCQMDLNLNWCDAISWVFLLSGMFSMNVFGFGGG